MRQYSSTTGRFTSVDPLWEKFPSQSPYHYSFNNPLLLADADGKMPILAPIAAAAMEALGVGIIGAIGVYIVVEMVESGMNYSEWMRTPAVSTAVDQPSHFLDISLDNGNVITVPQSYTETAEGQWGILFALMAAQGGGENQAPTTEPPVIPPTPTNGETPATKEQAAEVKALNGGKNSVTIPTADGHKRYDLDGKDHNGIETPHVHTFKKNIVNGVVKSVSEVSKDPAKATKQDVRTVRKYLEKQNP